MFRRISVLYLSFFISGMYFATTVFGLGSGGFRNEVVDAEAAGKGYCFTAQADGPSAVHYNPAGITQLDGQSLSLGYTYEAPRNECESSAAGNTVQMQKQVFFIPNFYYVTELPWEDFSFGLAAVSPYGLSTDWADDSFSKSVSTEANVTMYNINPTLAYKVNDFLSLGFGIDYFIADISKYKRTTAALGGGNFHLKVDDEGWGYNLGALIKPAENHRIGISYRSEIDLEYKGTASLDGLIGIYNIVFGGSTYSTALESDGTIPRTLAVGYAYQPNEKWTIETDVEWTDWACVEEEQLRYPNESDGNRLAVLNDGNPVSRDWNDVFSYGIGAEYKATDKLDLRCGFLYEETPIPSANLDTALPDANKHGVTLGAGYLFKNVQIDTSYAFFKFRDRDVTNDVGANTGSNIDGKYKAYVNIFAISFTYRY
jgi:long-chain fatty acid transport protein